MNRTCALFLLFALSFGTLFCAPEEPQEIRVHLPTRTVLHPLYIGRLQAHNFDASHAKTLEEILAYDLNYNGSTKVCPTASEKEAVLAEKQPSSAFRSSTWK